MASKESRLWRSKLAWKITIFMGLQSLLFYSLVAWLPVILQSRGMESGQAGWMLSAIQFAQLPFTFIVTDYCGAHEKPNSACLAHICFDDNWALGNLVRWNFTRLTFSNHNRRGSSIRFWSGNDVFLTPDT